MSDNSIQEENVVEQTPGGETPGEENSEEKKKKPVVTFEVKLHDFDEAIQISLDDEFFRPYVEKYGYDTTRLEEGKLKITIATEKRSVQKRKKAEQYAATRDFYMKYDKAKRTVVYHGQLGRLIFKENPDILDKLRLRGKKMRRFGDWIVDSEYFYDTILTMPEVIEAFGRFNVTQADLEAGKQEVLDTKAAAAIQQRAKSEAENATEEKIKAFADLESWMRKYLTVVDIALEDVPQYKEKVGIIVPYLKR